MTTLLNPDGSLNRDAAGRELTAELREIIGRHSTIAAHLKNIDRHVPEDWADAAQFLQNDEVLEGLEDNSRARIEELRAALRRLVDGSYGTCTRCGGTIAPARLAALPTSELCVGCAPA